MQRFIRCAVLAGAITVPMSAMAQVAQEPLFLGGGNVPGNLAIVPSVEFPTVNSVANLDTSYNPDRVYVGYFDSAKCYDYQGSDDESERHFFPVSITDNLRCPGPVWSGNYLNWATTQTIDPFRRALTGGLRVKDTPTETWVEKARHDGQGSYFPQRTVSGAALVADLTPFSADWIRSNIDGLDKQMRFELPAGASLQAGAAVPEATVRTLFEDSDFSNSDWRDYSNGDLSRNSDTNWVHSGSYSLLKQTHNDPHGGYRPIGEELATRRFVLHGWFNYRGGGGERIRLAVSDDDADGYGFNIGSSDIRVEKRTGGSGSNLGDSASWSRSDGRWYRFEFSGRDDNRFELKVFDDTGTLLQSVVSSADTQHTRFTRVYVHGGHDFYIDDLRLEVIEGGAPIGAQWPYVNQGGNLYDAAVRVKVCDPTVGVEDNCRPYAQGWKPEGLMQEYADRIRYSVFGYLNDSNRMRDGGVLRARQKFIGLRARDPDAGWASNGNAEWDETTGVLYKNPDATDASGTASYFDVTVEDSGAINYINKFGELNSNPFKAIDPVSELYYTATRYFRGLDPVPEYSTRYPAHDSSPSQATRARWVDGFPVIRDWDDPIQYSCQKNVILGIGDVYTHNDQNLPGNAGDEGEPTQPAEVSSDTDVDVNRLNAAVGDLEGLDLTDERYGSTRNAGYMIGLAFDARTRDIRADLDGKQSIRTYWVDVLENQRLEGVGRNQYWLTAKYGGFEPRCPVDDQECTLPDIDGPYDVHIPDPLPENWWFTNGEVLTQSGANLQRTDNYYPAGQAETMVAGLKKAFADIANNLTSTATALSFNGDRLKAGSLVYQAVLDTTYWSGDLQATAVSVDAAISPTVAWSAADTLDALSDAALDSRLIVTGSDLASDSDGGLKSTTARAFKWDNLTTAQQDALRKDDESGAVVDTTTAQRRVEYLRGNRSHEQAWGMRTRGSRLGDIVNSDPQYIHHENFGYESLSLANGFSVAVGQGYADYRGSSTYLNKKPVVAVGANDGMFHLFNAAANGGEELFAYVPVGIVDQLYKLTRPNYVHQYFVDGTARMGDAWLGDGVGWRTLAVATTGAGGASVFAIDITDPDAMGTNSVLWEYSNPKMGRLVHQPALVALPNGRFGVIVTSGYDAPQTESYVWILDAADGSLIREFELPSGELGAPLVIDLERDRVADRIYVGDTAGHIWRLDIEGSNTGLWGAPAGLTQGNTPKPLFTALDADGNPQPITAPLTATYNRDDEPMLLFGTGSFHQIGDSVPGPSPQVQSFYGIFDQGREVSGRSDLTEQTIILETLSGDYSARVVSQNALQLNDKGWYLDLVWAESAGGPGARGERVVSEASISGRQVVFSTLIPSDDPCQAGGDSWIMALNLYDGGRSSVDFFDYNGDGAVNSDDSLTVTVTDENGDEVEVQVPGSGIREEPSPGIVKSPSIVTADDGSRYVCYAGSGDTEKNCILVYGGMEQGRTSWREIISE